MSGVGARRVVEAAVREWALREDWRVLLEARFFDGLVGAMEAALTAYADARVAAAVETCAQIVEAFDDDAADGRLREAAAQIRAHRAPGAGAVVCKARTANHGAGDPPECDWPFCGCDPMADQVLAAIDESGYRLVRDGAPAADTGQEA